MKITYDTNLLQNYLASHNVTLIAEYKYVPCRKYKADYCIPEWRLLIEIQGGLFNKKAHGSITGLLKDIQRLNLATVNGFYLLRITPDDFRKTQCIEWVEMFRKQHEFK